MSAFWQGLKSFLQERGGEILNALGEHVYLTMAAMGMAIVLAVPVGLILTRAKRADKVVLGIVGVIQTLPSLALVGLMVPLLGAGPKAAIAALFLYALLPIVRNSYTGVRNIDPAITETARAMGMTSREILFRVELPLSVPIIMAGVRTSTVICVGVATLGGVVGAGGLGELIWIGIDRAEDALIFAGALPAMGLALLLDWVLSVGEWLFTPAGMREDKGSAQAGA